MADIDARLGCSCGVTHAVEERDAKVECGCGSVYIVTITRLNPLLEGDAVRT